MAWRVSILQLVENAKRKQKQKKRDKREKRVRVMAITSAAAKVRGDVS